MSLEEALKANTAALERHTALLEKGIATASGKATTGGAAAGGKPAGTKPSGKPAATKPKTVDVETVAARVTAYIKDPKTKDERDAHKDHVRQIIEYYGAEKFTAIDAESFPEALAMLDEFEAGNVPAVLATPDNDEGGEGDGDEDNMV